MKIFELILGLFVVVESVRADYKFITWNSNGASLNEVGNLLGRNHVLCIQEVGRLSRDFARLQEIRMELNTVDIAWNESLDGTDIVGGVKAYRFYHENVRFYLYFYEHPEDGANGESRKQNLAIITPKKARQVYIIPTHSRNGFKSPTIGIWLPGYLIFTTHPDSSEIDDTLAKVSYFMASSHQCQQLKWILMGDFRVEPHHIRFPEVPDGCFIDTAHPTQVARNNERFPLIAYGLYGGPSSRTDSLRARTLANLSSNYLPVAFETFVNNV